MVCAARRASAEAAPEGTGTPEPADAPAHAPTATAPTPAVTGSLADELGATLACLLQRARGEPDPERCRTLMECVRIGWGLLR